MKRFVLIIAGLLFTIFVTIVIATDTVDRQSPLRAAFGERRYSAGGLNKLSAEEQHELMGLWASVPRYSFLEESALRFMEQEGWDRIELFGYQTLDPGSRGFPKEYLIVFRKSDMNVLEPPLMADTLAPGQYWAKVSGSTWTVLSPSGKKIDFWAKDWK